MRIIAAILIFAGVLLSVGGLLLGAALQSIFVGIMVSSIGGVALALAFTALDLEHASRGR